jgi:uncharacterized membrane protein
VRYQVAWRVTHRGFWVAAGAAVLALTVPGWKEGALSALVGLLLGLLNVRMLSSGLRRGLALRGGGKSAALSLAGIIRLVLVIAVLAWLVVRGRGIEALPLLAGFFVPEAGFVTVLMCSKAPFDPGPGHEGDAA